MIDNGPPNQGGPNQLTFKLAENQEIEIELEVLLAYLEVYFKNAPGVQAILRMDIVTHEMLRAIDREIILYQSDCEALEKLTRDYVAGKIPGADYLDRNHD